jgi:tetratricopeptide (TPR) repeat protein
LPAVSEADVRRSPIAVLILSALLPGAAVLRAQSGDLGKIDFATSGSPEAQRHFLRGALLLHSFEFDDAAEEFRAAQKIEASFAMASWGEAMTYNHPLWMEQDRDAAVAVLKRLAPTAEARLAKAPTDREKGYLAAIEALYGDGDKAARDRAYAEAMRRLHEKYPDDLDAASFYALALLGTCEGKRDYAVYMKAAAIAEDVFAKSPLHPGAVHYLIHCYDDPIHAPLGMRAARVYAKIAPSAGHALHMPSHIFFASGMWEDADASNTAAWQASLERARRKGLGPEDHNFHALLWLEYGQLELGRYADARQTLALMEKDAAASGSARARTHLALMKAAYLVETRRWEGDVARLAVRSDDLGQRGLLLFVDGFGAAERSDRAAAEKALAAMRAGGSESSGHDHGGSGYAMGGRRASPDAILALELEARILEARKDTPQAIARARDAAETEDKMAFEFGPPLVAKPAHELLGEMLLASGRPAEARQEFEASLARAPGRALSLLGLARAAAKAGDTEAARRAYGELAANWRHADPDVPERVEVEGRLAALRP